MARDLVGVLRCVHCDRSCEFDDGVLWCIRWHSAVEPNGYCYEAKEKEESNE